MYTYQHPTCAPYFKTYTFLFFREYSLFIIIIIIIPYSFLVSSGFLVYKGCLVQPEAIDDSDVRYEGCFDLNNAAEACIRVLCTDHQPLWGASQLECKSGEESDSRSLGQRSRVSTYVFLLLI
jgi:hypothetical protein